MAGERSMTKGGSNDVEWNGSWHPLAERFPMLSEDEIREMAESIRERGQYVPCRMDAQGIGLDGRNRIAACALVGVEAWWEVYEGEPIPFIVEVNSERRHLTTGQRAMAVAIGLVESGKRKDGKFARGSVPKDARTRSRTTERTWSDKLHQAGVVLDHAPELADSVLSGELALDAAYKAADDRRKAGDRVKALGGELAALVEAGVIDVVEAERRVQEEKRLALLDEDLAERVRDGNLSLDEGEDLARQRAARNEKWIADVNEALDVLVPMANGPLPAMFKERLSPERFAALAAALKLAAWKHAREEVQQ